MSEMKICTTAELVEFVTSHIMEGYEPATFGNLMCKQVADRLNALESERDALAIALANMPLRSDNYALAVEVRALEAERDRLREALEAIRDYRPEDRPRILHLGDCRDIAAQALGGA